MLPICHSSVQLDCLANEQFSSVNLSYHFMWTSWDDEIQSMFLFLIIVKVLARWFESLFHVFRSGGKCTDGETRFRLTGVHFKRKKLQIEPKIRLNHIMAN